MKNIKFSIYVMIATVIFMTSCSTTNHVVRDSFIAKRKYMKGYHMQTSAQHKKENVSNKQKTVHKEISDLITSRNEDPILSASGSEKAIIIQYESKKSIKPSKKLPLAIQSISKLYESDAKGFVEFTKEYKKNRKEFVKTFIHKKGDTGGSAGLSVASFAFAIAGLLILGLIFGAVAIILGAIALIKKDSKGKGLAVLGIIIGTADVVIILLLLASL